MSANSQFQEKHASVMFNEVMQYMQPTEGELYVDGTFGAGGHTHGMLSAADCAVIGIDRDDTVAQYRKVIEQEFGERFTFLAGRFSEMETLLAAKNITQVDGILLDIGVSSMQLDNGERGFSFQEEGPLDMRMGQGGQTVGELIASLPEEELANVIYRYGDERDSRRIARNIVQQRSQSAIETTTQLADIVRRSVRRKSGKIHPATKTFQALRIYVNDELRELELALEASERILKPGGRLVVITFHSGEDIIVKQFLKEKSGRVSHGMHRHLPPVMHELQPDVEVASFELISRKAIKPSEQEVMHNPRARSAKLRAARKCPVADDIAGSDVNENSSR